MKSQAVRDHHDHQPSSHQPSFHQPSSIERHIQQRYIIAMQAATDKCIFVFDFSLSITAHWRMKLVG